MRGQKFLQIIRSSSRAILHGQCVFIPGALLKASQHKNEESGEGWRFPNEILANLDSSFLRSIMRAGGSIILLPSCLLITCSDCQLSPLPTLFSALSYAHFASYIPTASVLFKICVCSDSSDLESAENCGV